MVYESREYLNSRRYFLTCRSERSEESPDKLSFVAQFVGDSSLPAVAQNDMIILILDTLLVLINVKGNRMRI